MDQAGARRAHGGKRVLLDVGVPEVQADAHPVRRVPVHDVEDDAHLAGIDRGVLDGEPDPGGDRVEELVHRGEKGAPAVRVPLSGRKRGVQDHRSPAVPREPAGGSHGRRDGPEPVRLVHGGEGVPPVLLVRPNVRVQGGVNARHADAERSHPPRDRVGRREVAGREVGRHRPDLREGEAVPGIERKNRLVQVVEGEQVRRQGNVQGVLPYLGLCSCALLRDNNMTVCLRAVAAWR